MADAIVLFDVVYILYVIPEHYCVITGEIF